MRLKLVFSPIVGITLNQNRFAASLILSILQKERVFEPTVTKIDQGQVFLEHSGLSRSFWNISSGTGLVSMSKASSWVADTTPTYNQSLKLQENSQLSICKCCQTITPIIVIVSI